jgi:hypothetical protein
VDCISSSNLTGFRIFQGMVSTDFTVHFKLEAVSLTFHSVLRKLYTELSICASYQVSVHLDERFQRRRFFRNRPIRNKNCLWWPCLWMHQDEMSNLYRGPYIGASYQFSVHLAKGFQRRLKCEKFTERRRTTDQVMAITYIAFGKAS